MDSAALLILAPAYLLPFALTNTLLLEIAPANPFNNLLTFSSVNSSFVNSLPGFNSKLPDLHETVYFPVSLLNVTLISISSLPIGSLL